MDMMPEMIHITDMTHITDQNILLYPIVRF